MKVVQEMSKEKKKKKKKKRNDLGRLCLFTGNDASPTANGVIVFDETHRAKNLVSPHLNLNEALNKLGKLQLQRNLFSSEMDMEEDDDDDDDDDDDHDHEMSDSDGDWKQQEKKKKKKKKKMVRQEGGKGKTKGAGDADALVDQALSNVLLHCDSTKTGLAVMALIDRCPNARVLLSSATAFEDPRHLAYASSLRLWGEGSCFDTFLLFYWFMGEGSKRNKKKEEKKKSTNGNRFSQAKLELVAHDLASRRRYACRLLSFKGMDFDITRLKLQREQQSLW